LSLKAILNKLNLKKKKQMAVSMGLMFVMIAGAAFFFYFSDRAEPEDNLPPIIKQIMVLNEDVRKTTIEIYAAMGKLDSLGMVQSRQTDIESGIKTIGILRDLAEKNQGAIDRLIHFIEDHSDFVHRKNLSWVFAVNEFYRDPYFIEHNQSQADYFAAFETLLTYTGKNFLNIMEIRSRAHMVNYDAYYLRYRKAADGYNRFNKKRIEFERAFVEEHPDVKPFLPGTHQAGDFRFWDKFSL